MNLEIRVWSKPLEKESYSVLYLQKHTLTLPLFNASIKTVIKDENDPNLWYATWLTETLR